MSDQTRIVKVYFPRTDFPETGWIDKVPGSLWEYFLYQPVYSETLSFRMEDRKQDKFYIRQDQPKFEWFYPVINANIASRTPSEYESKSFRLHDKLFSQKEKDQSLFIPEISNDQGWINFVNIPSVDPALVPKPESFRMSDPVKDKFYILQDVPKDAWQVSFFDFQFKQPPTDATRVDRTYFPRTDFPQDGWLWNSSPLVILPYGVYDYPAINSQSQSFRTKDKPPDFKEFYELYPRAQTVFRTIKDQYYIPNEQGEHSAYLTPSQIKDRTYIWQDEPRFEWMVTIPPNYDETHFPRNEEGNFRTKDANYDKNFILQTEPDFGWIFFPNIPAVDPQYVAMQMLASFRSNDRIIDKTYILQDQPEWSWIFALGLKDPAPNKKRLLPVMGVGR